MISVIVTLLIAGSGADLRHDFADCLKQADAKAQNQKIAPDAFVDFARTTCSTAADPFEASLTTVNVKNGMSKKAAAADAAGQIKDYYTERLENYKIELQPLPEDKPK
jgi:hypothetical protein